MHDVIYQVNTDMEWYLIVGGYEKEPQILYNVETPKYSFRNGKLFNESPSWLPIHIEVPTRQTNKINDWIRNKSRTNIYLIEKHENTILTQWTLENAYVHNSMDMKSRTIDYIVTHLIIKYTWAKKDTG